MLAVLVATGVVELWHVFVFAAAARRRQRDRDAGAPVVRLRAGRHRSAAQRALAVGGHLQHRADRRPGAGRRRPSPLVRHRPGLPDQHRAGDRAGLHVLAGCARPSCTGRSCRRATSGTRPGSSTACGTCWQRGDLLLPIALMVGDRHARLQLPGHAGRRWPRPCSTPARRPSACSPRRSRWARSRGALAGSGRRGRPSAYVVLGAAVAFGALRDAGRVRAHVLAGRRSCSCRPGSSWSTSPRPPTSGCSWAPTRRTGAG